MSCFYGSEDIQDFSNIVSEIMSFKIVYDAKGKIPDYVNNRTELIKYALEDVQSLDHSKLFDFEPYQDLIDKKEKVDCIETWIRIVPTDRENAETICENIQEFFNVETEIFMGEFATFNLGSELLVYSSEVFHEEFLFFISLIDTRNYLMKLGSENL